MQATPETVDSLRLKLGEAIPVGGTDADSLFTDAQLINLLLAAPFLDRAAYEGWKIKAAHFANLVNVTDGASAREFSKLYDNAISMLRAYDRSQPGPTSGRTRIGRIVRR